MSEDNLTLTQYQEKLDYLDSIFNQYITQYPEDYKESKVYKTNGNLNNTQSILHDVNNKMVMLYNKLKAQNIDNRKKEKQYKTDQSILENIFDDLTVKYEDVIPSNTAGQLKTDKVILYRHNMVRLLYLLGGIGILSGSIYHLIK